MFPKHLISIADLTINDIENIFRKASFFKNTKESILTSNNQEITLIFNEVSTRTFLSFEIAINRLGYRSYKLLNLTSSMQKGESLSETLNTVFASGIKLAVIRDNQKIKAHNQVGIINAGDSIYNHPTQVIADLYTIQERLKLSLKDLKGKKRSFLLLGDIVKSRVANSLLQLLEKFAFEVILVDPYSEISKKSFNKNVTILQYQDINKVWKEIDIVYILRPQLERHFLKIKNLVLLNEINFSQLKKSAIVMHPGPITQEVDDKIKTYLTTPRLQVTNSIFIRMAILELMMKYHYGR